MMDGLQALAGVKTRLAASGSSSITEHRETVQRTEAH